MTTSPRERRRAPRARADFPIRLSPLGSATPARLKDLSAIGLCCTTGQKIEEMTLVGIELQLPGQPDRHAVQGAVVRCEPTRAQKGQYEVAVYFTEITDAARSAVNAYVAQGSPV